MLYGRWVGCMVKEVYTWITSARQHFKPLTLYCDNKSAVFFLSNNKSSDAAKHIDIKYFVVKDRVHNQTIEIENISTKQMLADPLMKGVAPNIFHDHVAGMGLLESL
jgi:hypothetical protein